MNFSAHFYVAIVASVIFFYVFQLDFQIGMLAAGLILLGALIPDIDAQEGKINNYIESIFIFIFIVSFAVFLYTMNEIFMIICIIFAIFLAALYSLKHRGFFHGIFFMLFVVIAVWYITNNFILPLAFVIGFLTHKALDYL